jgi:hypothetical protein
MWATEMRENSSSRLMLIEADPNTYGLLKHSLDINGFGPPSFVENLNLAVGLESGHTFWKYPYGRVLNARVAEKTEVDAIPRCVSFFAFFFFISLFISLFLFLFFSSFSFFFLLSFFLLP